MEIKEAIEQIKWYFEKDDGEAAENKTKEAAYMAISALEKQEAKKPFYNGMNYECPYCNVTIINGVKPWYCDICGQRIDWSE